MSTRWTCIRRGRGGCSRVRPPRARAAEELVARDLGRVLLACEEHAEQAVRAAQRPPTGGGSCDRGGAGRRRSSCSATRTWSSGSSPISRRSGWSVSRRTVWSATSPRSQEAGSAVGGDRAVDVGGGEVGADGGGAGDGARRGARSVLGDDRPELVLHGRVDLAHKVLAVAEEEGAERAAYALKLLQSEGNCRSPRRARTRQRPAGHPRLRCRGRSRSSSRPRRSTWTRSCSTAASS